MGKIVIDKDWVEKNYHGEENFVVPDGITEIGKSAFDGCNSLKTIRIPDSVTEIGEQAFAFCKSLKSINIPESVTKIRNGAFYNCKSLKSIRIPDGVTEIEFFTFNSCSSLESIHIPDSVTKIGKEAFWGCASLKSIRIPDSVTEIGNSAFEECENLPADILKQVAPKQASPKRKTKSGVKKYLLQYSDNWADEFNVEGSVLVDEEGFAMLNELKERFETQEESGCCVGLGSNQFIEYESVSELIDHIECVKLNKAESEAVQKLGFDSYGFTNFYDTLQEIWENANDSE